MSTTASPDDAARTWSARTARAPEWVTKPCPSRRSQRPMSQGTLPRPIRCHGPGPRNTAADGPVGSAAGMARAAATVRVRRSRATPGRATTWGLTFTNSPEAPDAGACRSPTPNSRSRLRSAMPPSTGHHLNSLLPPPCRHAGIVMDASIPVERSSAGAPQSPVHDPSERYTQQIATCRIRHRRAPADTGVRIQQLVGGEAGGVRRLVRPATWHRRGTPAAPDAASRASPRRTPGRSRPDHDPAANAHWNPAASASAPAISGPRMPARSPTIW